MKLRAITGWYWEAVCLLVYLAIAGTQLFQQPIVGMADNGDFPKVLGRFDVCDPNGQRDEMAYVYPAYIIDEKCRFDSQLMSSEKFFVGVIKQVAVWSKRLGFRIGSAGKAHLVVVVLALIVLLWGLHDASFVIRFGLPPLAIFIFSDVAYVSYLNSFYMDAASMVFLLLTVSLAAAWMVRPRGWIAIVFATSGALLGLSKSQHVFTSFFLAGLAAWFAVRAFRTSQKFDGWRWAISAGVVTIATAATITMTPAFYTGDPLYNLLFFQLLPGSDDAAQTLRELELPRSYLDYKGTFAYSEKSPLGNPEWQGDFVRRMTYRRLVFYYLRNPTIAMSLADGVLHNDLSGIRPNNLGNYQRDAGFPPATRANSFSTWTNLRIWLLLEFPYHVVAFYGLMGIGCTLCFFRKTWAARWPLYPLAAVITLSGTVEFLSSATLDCVENARHLFLFHVITEILIVCAAAAVLSSIGILLRTEDAQ